MRRQNGEFAFLQRTLEKSQFHRIIAVTQWREIYRAIEHGPPPLTRRNAPVGPPMYASFPPEPKGRSNPCQPTQRQEIHTFLPVHVKASTERISSRNVAQCFARRNERISRNSNLHKGTTHHRRRNFLLISLGFRTFLVNRK